MKALAKDNAVHPHTLGPNPPHPEPPNVSSFFFITLEPSDTKAYTP